MGLEEIGLGWDKLLVLVSQCTMRLYWSMEVSGVNANTNSSKNHTSKRKWKSQKKITSIKTNNNIFANNFDKGPPLLQTMSNLNKYNDVWKQTLCAILWLNQNPPTQYCFQNNMPPWVGNSKVQPAKKH